MTLPPLSDLRNLREAFEAYFSNSRRGRGVKKIPVFKRLPDDSYADEPTQRHWWTWQNAARAAIAAHVPEAGCGNIAAVPAQPGIRTLSSEQIECHTLTASECPPDSAVMLVSSINRPLSKRPGDAARFAQPVAWAYVPSDVWRDTIITQDTEQAAEARRLGRNVQPLYAAPQAVPVPAWQPIDTAPKDGRRVLVWISEKHQTGCAFAKLWFYSNGRLGGGAEGYSGDWNITHWMPLPAAPKEQPHE